MNRVVLRVLLAAAWLAAGLHAQVTPASKGSGADVAGYWKTIQSAPLPPPITPGPENWREAFAGQRPNGTVWALAVDQAGRVFIGGDFTMVGSLPANRIAMWDGHNWQVLGTGVNGIVEAIVVAPGGQVYVGGRFTTAGDLSARYVARWDPAAGWSSLSSGMNSYVYALALDASGGLYAGGAFSTAGGATAGRLAYWSGGAWSAVGGGVSGTVYGLALTSTGELWVVGSLSKAGSLTVSNVARWDGTTWWAAGSGLVTNYPQAAALDAQGRLWVVGDFTFAGGKDALGVAWWDGAQWNIPPGGCCVGANDVAVDGAGNIYVGGDFTIAQGGGNFLFRWNGTDFAPLPSGPTLAVNALASAGGRLLVGGAFQTINGSSSPYLAEWIAGDGACGLGSRSSATLYPYDKPVTLQVNQPGSLDCLTIQRVQANHPAATAHEQTGQYWSLRGLDASAAPAQGFNLDLTLPFATAGPGDRICRYMDELWSDCAAAHVNDGQSVTRTGLTGFSEWLVQDNDPMAVTAAGLSAAHLGPGRVSLEWDTDGEVGILAFNLYEGGSPTAPGTRLTSDPLPAQAPGTMRGAHYQLEIAPGACLPDCWYWLEVLQTDGNEWLGPAQLRQVWMMFLPLLNKP